MAFGFKCKPRQLSTRCDVFCVVFFLSLKLHGMNVTINAPSTRKLIKEKLWLQMFQSVSIKLAITGVLTKLLLHQK